MWTRLKAAIDALSGFVVGLRATVYGTAATGQLRVGTVVNNETIVIDGVTFTAKTSSPSGVVQYLIGTTPEETAANLAVILNASVNAAISVATYEAVADKINITYDTKGLAGNAFTLAESSSGGIAVSGATLTGGLGGVSTSAATYKASISQTGTDAPTVANAKNTTGGTLVWGYAGTGDYILTISGTTFGANPIVTVGGCIIGFIRITFSSTSIIRVRTFDATGAASDNILQNTGFTVEI